MNYKEFAERIQNNLRYGNRYMGNTLYRCISELSTSNVKAISIYSEETLEILKNLKEPFNYNTGSLVDIYSLEKLTEISHETINILNDYF